MTVLAQDLALAEEEEVEVEEVEEVAAELDHHRVDDQSHPLPF
jgi:hypothetical protein